MAVAQELNSSVFEASGVVKSVSPVEIRVSRKYAPGHYFLYIFKINDKTRIIGLVQKGAFVRVKYSRKRIVKGFIFTAQEIEVFNPANPYYYQKTY